MPVFRRNDEQPAQRGRSAGASRGQETARPAPSRAPGLPDPTATERPITLLLLSEDPTLPHALWNALVQGLGEAEAMRRYNLPRWRFPSGNGLLAAVKRHTPRADVVLVDVRAHAGLAELEEQHYQGFTRVPAQFEPEGELLRPPVVALAPNHPELVHLNEDEEWVFQPQWEQYFVGWGYAGALVFPDDAALLHRVLQEVLEQPHTPRAALPPPPASSTRAVSPRTAERPATQASRSEDHVSRDRVAAQDDMPPAWAPQPVPPRPAGPTADPQRVAHHAAFASESVLQQSASLTGLGDVASVPLTPPRLSGVVAVWSPFDLVGRTTLALELAVGLRQAGYPTLLGEFRRPFGFLAQKLTLDDESFACSLLALAGAVNASFTRGGPFVLPREAVQRWLLRGLPLYDLRRQSDGPRLEFFHTGFTARQEAYYELEVLQDPKQAMLRQLIEMLKEWPTFTMLITGSTALDPVHFAALAKCDRLLICLPLEVSLFGVAAAAIQLLLRHCPKSAGNMDVVFTRWNTAVPEDAWRDSTRAWYETGELAEGQQQQLLLQTLKIEREVEGLLSACGLSSIAAFLPDERPLTRELARHKPVAPALMQEDLAQEPYVLAIKRQLLPTYISLPAAAPSLSNGHSRAKRFFWERGK